MKPNDQEPSTDGENSTPIEPMQSVNPTEQETITPEAPAEVVQPDIAPSATATPQEETAPVVAPTAAAIGLPPMQPVSGSEIAKKKGVSKKVKIIALIIGLLVILIGGSVGAYFGVIAPSKPQRIVQDSLTNTVSTKITSAKFEGEVSCVSGDACKSASALTFSGSANDKGSLDVKLQLKTVVAAIGVDLRSVGDKSIYLRLSGLDGLDKLLAGQGGSSQSSSLFASYAPIIRQVNNQWYTIDESLLKQAGGSVGAATNETSLSEADAKKIGDIYKKHQFITVLKKLPNEKIHNQDSYHVQVSVDKAQFKAFATELKSSGIKTFNFNDIDQKDIDAIDKIDFSKYPVDMWVGKSDRKVSQLATTITEKENTVKVRVAIFDYNKPVTVEKPAGAKSVMELIGELSGSLGGSSSVRGANTDSFQSLLGL